MIVNRTVFLNPVEPEFLAFRLSSGVDTKVDFHFKAQTGAPHPEDVVAQLQLTGRTNDQTEYFSVPAVDIVNGVARAVIPAGFNYDPNGWRLRLTGTVNQEPRVIAYGVVTAVAGAGPQVEPQDVIDSIDIKLTYTQPTMFTVKVWQDESKYTPYDLAASSVGANIYSAPGGFVLMPFTVSAVVGNEVTLSLTAAQVDTLPASCWWTLTIVTGPGLTTLAQGKVTVTALP